MNRVNYNNLTQRQELKTVPADDIYYDFKVDGDYIRVEDLSGTLYWSINGGPDVKIALGATLQGTPGQSEMQFVRFRNKGGSSVAVRVVFGRGLYQVTGAIAGTVSLTASDISAVNPAAFSLIPGLGRTSGAGTVAAGKRMVSIAALSGSITVLGVTIAYPGSVEFVAQGRFDTIGAVAYDASGGEAMIATLT
jgi:hypothetical protein